MVPFISAIFYLQVQWMVIGEAGGLGPSVPRAVVEELKQEGDSVTTKPTVEGTAMVITLNRDGATLTPVQVNTLFGLQDMTKFWHGPTLRALLGRKS